MNNEMHVIAPIIAEVETYLGSQIVKIEKVFGGLNNQSYKLNVKNEAYFLKCYATIDDGTAMQRFDHEITFSSLLKSRVSSVPQLINSDRDLGYGLFEFIEGHEVKEPNVHSIIQAAKFIAQINSPEIIMLANTLPEARGSLNSFKDVLYDLDFRFNSLKSIESRDECDDAMIEFLKSHWQPRKQAYEEVLDDRLHTMSFTRCVSPSDFGFHNIISDGNLYFTDFEYSGWDSGEKLITDFFAQPRYEIEPTLMTDFVGHTQLDKQGTLLEQCRALLPFTHLKWALIYLNDFKSLEGKRRAVVRDEKELTKTKSVQLQKAKTRLNRLDELTKGLQ